MHFSLYPIRNMLILFTMLKKPPKLVLSLYVFFVSLTSFCMRIAVSQNTTTAVNVGVVLDLKTLTGKIALSCINVALSDFYASHANYKTRLGIHPRDSKSSVVGAAAAALDLLKNVQAQAILGPQTSMQADFVTGLGDEAQVPIITFSATSPLLSSIRSPYFIRATQNDTSQAKAISAILKAFGWRQAVPIYVDNEFGDGLALYLTDVLQKINVQVPYRSVISETATDDQILAELYKLMTMQTRVFILHMLPSLGARIFARAKEIGMMNEGYVWILTNGMTNLFSSFDSVDLDSMQGALGVKTFVPRTEALENFRARWKRNFLQENPKVVDPELDMFGLWAHDAAVALAIAVEKAGTANLAFHRANVTSNSSTDLEAVGVSPNGPNLLQALMTTKFKGLAGDFALLEGQLQSSAFEIVNMYANGERGVGFWTPRNGLARTLSSSNNSKYCCSKENLGPIIWPGESTSIPKGWKIPTQGKKLRIAVPVKDGFKEFVSVTHDRVTNTTRVEGYSIAIFEAVMEALPYSVSYDYIPFAKIDGRPAGPYNLLVDQVYYQNVDAVVGDITIVANRSEYIDFTLAYTESGVHMIVPVKDHRKRNAWVFLEPLTLDLWLTIGCFFIFIGFVVWILEHRVNEDFRGPPTHQAGTSFWFSFSIMVFAHRERVVSNLARFVLVVWCFVVLILTQSYTASLTSLLTVKQLQPTITDINWLIRNGEAVGYQDGSFFYEVLKRLGFKEDKLRPYGSLEEWNDLFLKGTANGGIAAAFDEVPYMKLFLSKYCSKYTMVEPSFKTGGFGFVFPKGSPMVADVSRAILTVIEGDKMQQIENEWFGKFEVCSERSASVSSSRLGTESFWGLFVIAGIAATLALSVFIAMFIFQHKHLWKDLAPEASLWTKIVVMWKHFDNKDLSSHTFRKGEQQDRSGIESIHARGGDEASPTMNYPASPWSYSNDTGSNFAGSEISLSPEHGTANPSAQATQNLVPSSEFINPFQTEAESYQHRP